jgi:hypothetical protein
VKRNFYSLEEIELIHEVKALDFEYNLQYGPWQGSNGVPREIWDSIPNEQHNLPVEDDGLGHTIWNAISYGKRMNAAMKRLLVEGPRDHAGSPPYDDRWGRSRPSELPYEVALHHRKLNCKDGSNWQDPDARGADLSESGIKTEVPIGGGYGGGNQFLWHQDFWYWGHGNGPLKNNTHSPNVSPWPDLATCFSEQTLPTHAAACLSAYCNCALILLPACLTYACLPAWCLPAQLRSHHATVSTAGWRFSRAATAAASLALPRAPSSLR